MSLKNISQKEKLLLKTYIIGHHLKRKFTTQENTYILKVENDSCS